MPGPPPDVLDLFAVPDVVEPLGGRAGRVRAGDLVLSPGHDDATATWLSPVLARLAVALDERPGRARRDLRIAMPVPARDGSWVVRGWGASRWEPGTEACRDLAVTLAAGRLLHAELASVVTTRPAGLDEREDRRARAERMAFGPVGDLPDDDAVRRVVAQLEDTDLGRDQLVHADLAGNVLLDGAGAPVVIDVSPAWRPVRWAEAVCALDWVVSHAATRTALERWRTGVDRQAMLRAVLFRVLSDDPRRPASYEPVISALGG